MSISSKDEYLITDAPLRALTIFALPMILGSFFQQVYMSAGVWSSCIIGRESTKPSVPRTMLRTRKLMREVDTIVFIRS